jgi:hypothetical protein
VTRPPIEHTERRPGGYHHHDHKASKRLVTMIDAMDELLERNRRVKERLIVGRPGRPPRRHPHYPHHPRKLWDHEGSVAGDVSIISLDGEKAHFAPPKGLEEDRRVPLPHEGAPYQPIQGGVHAIMERVRAGHERDGGEL